MGKKGSQHYNGVRDTSSQVVLDTVEI